MLPKLVQCISSSAPTFLDIKLNAMISEIQSIIEKDITSVYSSYSRSFNTYLELLNIIKNDWRSYEARSKYVNTFSWAIPSLEALLEIAKYKNIIEIYSGTGYWAYLLSKLDVNIKCFDNFSWFHYKENNNFGKYYKVENINNYSLSSFENCNLMISWPPYGDTKCLKYLKEIKPQILIYIGEGIGGCNAFDQFFHYVEKFYDEEKYVKIPQWSGIHDYLIIYKRK